MADDHQAQPPLGVLYDAFISYRRSDGQKVARWLRRELESFRPPKSLRPAFQRKLRIYLDTAYERGSSDFYEQNIKPALLSSRALVVIATPAAVRRPDGSEDWIDREVRDYTAGANGANVVVVRGAGEFNDPLPSDLKQRFPNIEIIDLRGAGRLWFLNPISAARLAAEKLKLIAPLLGIPIEEMPKLRREEERRQQTRLGGIVGVALGVLVAVTGLNVYALISRNQTFRALEDSMFAAGGMAVLASDLAESDDEAGRIRRIIVNHGCDLVDRFRQGAITEPRIDEDVTCRLERARDHERLNEQAEAQKRYAEAIEEASRRHRRQPRLDAGTSLLKARDAYAAYLKRHQDIDGAAAEYDRMVEDARTLAAAHAGFSQFPRSEAEGLGQRGDLERARGDRAKAAASYDAAAAAVEKAVEAQSERNNQGLIDWLARLRRLAGEQYVELDQAVPAIAQFRQSVAVRARNSVAARPDIDQEIAVIQAHLFILERKRGDVQAAEIARKEAFARLDAVAMSATASSDLKKKAAALKSWIESQAKP